MLRLLALALLAGCAAAPDPGPWIGEQRLLVVPAAWPDAPAPHDRATIEDSFFDAADSFAAWLDENSAGVGTVTGAVLDWSELGGAWSDLADCDPEGVIDAGWSAVEDAVDVDAFDADGNGLIDHLVVLHAGRTADDRVSWRCLFADHPAADSAAALPAQGLGQVGDQIPVGLYAHEAGHAFFSLRDQYGDHYHGDYGVGIWDAMGLGQWGPNNQVDTAALWRTPSHLAAPHKATIGWLEPQVVQQPIDDLRIDPVELGGGVVRIPQGDEDLWLEVRSPRGFSAELPGHGLLVWRTYGDRRLELIQADGRDDLAHGDDLGARPVPPIDANFGDDSDPFPGSLGVTSVQAGAELHSIRHEGDAVIVSIRP